jgi:outer membrane protein TolC
LPSPPADLAVEIPARVLRQRPDVRTSEEQLAGAAERVAASEANRYPTVQLRASLAWSAVTLGAVGSTAPAAALIAGLAQPLFDGGQRAAQRELQWAAFDAAREAYRAQVLLALREVEDALVQLDGSRRRLASLRQAAQAADAAALLATQRYASGIVDFQVVLDTQRSLLVVQESLTGAQADWVTNHIRLYKALGGGWRADAPATENPG